MGSPSSTMSPASAASEPVAPGRATATPTSAEASAGPSFTPSPTMSTFRPPACASVTHRALSAGDSSATTRPAPVSRINPDSRAIRTAVASRSPDSITRSTSPNSRSSSSALTDEPRNTSRSPSSPSHCPPDAISVGNPVPDSPAATAVWKRITGAPPATSDPSASSSFQTRATPNGTSPRAASSSKRNRLLSRAMAPCDSSQASVPTRMWG